MMKPLSLALLFLASPVFAQEKSAPSPKPTCEALAANGQKIEGSTVEECQKVVDSVNAQLAAANKRISAYRELLSEANDRVTVQASK